MVHAFTVILTLAASATAQSPSAAIRSAVVKQFKPGDDGPGVCIGIVPHASDRPYSTSFGQANLDAKTAISPATRFELASVGKILTAIAVLKLCEDGRLAVGDDVRKHLPELPAPPAGKPVVRIADLLRHTSGLPDYMAFADVTRANPRFATNLDFLPEFARQKAAHPATAAGQKFAYNNTNYMLLAVVVARAAETPYPAYLKKAVFDPAGMAHSFVMDSHDTPPRHPTAGRACAVGYTRRPDKTWAATWGAPPNRRETLLTVGDGAIWSSLEDLVALDAALRSDKLLKPTTAAAALRLTRTSDKKLNTYGLGFQTYPSPAGGLYGFGHDGTWGGFKTSFYVDLTKGRTYIILGNRDDLNTDKLFESIDGALR